jgi:hypothetical protein
MLAGLSQERTMRDLRLTFRVARGYSAYRCAGRETNRPEFVVLAQIRPIMLDFFSYA